MLDDNEPLCETRQCVYVAFSFSASLLEFMVKKFSELEIRCSVEISLKDGKRIKYENDFDKNRLTKLYNDNIKSIEFIKVYERTNNERFNLSFNSDSSTGAFIEYKISAPYKRFLVYEEFAGDVIRICKLWYSPIVIRNNYLVGAIGALQVIASFVFAAFVVWDLINNILSETFVISIIIFYLMLQFFFFPNMLLRILLRPAIFEGSVESRWKKVIAYIFSGISTILVGYFVKIIHDAAPMP